MSKDKPIFLYDSNLAGWDRPLSPGATRLKVNDSFVTTLRSKGEVGSLASNVGMYRIMANAVKYMADVPRPIGNHPIDELTKFDIVPSYLFDGVLSVYKRGNPLPESNHVYTSRDRVERIWFACPADCRTMTLKEIILGERGSRQFPEMMKRLGLIFRGYDEQHKEEREHDQRREMSARVHAEEWAARTAPIA